MLFSILTDHFTAIPGPRSRSFSDTNDFSGEPEAEDDPDLKRDSPSDVEIVEENQEAGGVVNQDPATPQKRDVLPELKTSEMTYLEQLAYRMGGECMMRPTPSPRSPWTSGKNLHGVGDTGDQQPDLDAEIQRLEHPN